MELVGICIKVRSGNHLPVEPDHGIRRGAGMPLWKDCLRGGDKMPIKGAKTIAEYAFRKWMEDAGFMAGMFNLELTGKHEAVIRDKAGDTMKLIYDPESKTVFSE